MKKLAVVLVLQLVLGGLGFAQGAWVNLSSGLNELTIEALAVDPKDPKVIFAGSERHVYKTMDSGVSWKRVLGLRGNDNRVRFIYIDTTNPKDVYVCTERGVYRSQDAGKKWGLFFRGVGEQDKAVFCIQSGLQNPTNIYIGTRRGVFIVQSNGGETKKAAGLPDTAVYSILQ